MTLIFTEGFDLYNISANFTQYGGWQFTGSSGSDSWVTGRVAGQALSRSQGNTSGSGYAYNLAANHATLTVGLAFRIEGGLSAIGENIIGFIDTATIQTDVRFDTTGHLLVTRNGTTLATATSVLPLQAWQYLEFQTTFGTGTSGAYALRLNGQTVPGIPDTSGVNTSGSGSAFANFIRIQQGFTSINPQAIAYDDLYLCNGLGPVNNTFLGDIGIRTLLPNAVGSNSNFAQTGGTGGQSFTSVNENPHDSDTSYVASSTISQEDTYMFSNLPSNVTSVLGVVSRLVGRKDDVGNRHITTQYFSGVGAEASFTGTDYTLSNSYTMYRMVQETNPVTSLAWGINEINTGEFGPRVSS